MTMQKLTKLNFTFEIILPKFAIKKDEVDILITKVIQI